MKRGYDYEQSREGKEPARGRCIAKKIGAVGLAVGVFGFFGAKEYDIFDSQMVSGTEERQSQPHCYPLEDLNLGATIRHEEGSDRIKIALSNGGNGIVRSGMDTEGIPIEELSEDPICISARFAEDASINYDSGRSPWGLNHASGSTSHVLLGSRTLKFVVSEGDFETGYSSDTPMYFTEVPVPDEGQ